MTKRFEKFTNEIHRIIIVEFNLDITGSADSPIPASRKYRYGNLNFSLDINQEELAEKILAYCNKNLKGKFIFDSWCCFIHSANCVSLSFNYYETRIDLLLCRLESYQFKAKRVFKNQFNSILARL